MRILSVVLVTLGVIAMIQAGIVVSSEDKAKIDESRKACREELEIDEDTLKKWHETKLPNDPKFKEFLYCVSKRLGFQNEAGDVQKDVVIQRLGDAIQDTDKAKETAEECVHGSGIDAAYDITKCLYASFPDYVEQFE